MEKIKFLLEKREIEWIDYIESKFNGKPNLISLRQKIFDHHPYAVGTIENSSRMKIGNGRVQIPFRHGCDGKAVFILVGKWNHDEEEIVFEAEINMENCCCTPDSISKFYKKSPVIGLGLMKKNKMPTIFALKFPHIKKSAIGVSYFPTVTEDGSEEIGQMHEVCCTILQPKKIEPIRIVGGIAIEAYNANYEALAAVRNELVKRKISTKVLDDNELLVSLEDDDYDIRVGGPSLTLALGVAFFSLAVGICPKVPALITGKLRPTGEIYGVGGLEVKLNCAKENKIEFLYPDENKDEIQSTSHSKSFGNFSDVIDYLFKFEK